MAMASDKGQKLLEACERGELRVVAELVKIRAVDPRKVADQRHDRYIHGYDVKGWTPLHYACL
jgi:ankyrin repeat protein